MKTSCIRAVGIRNNNIIILNYIYILISIYKTIVFSEKKKIVITDYSILGYSIININIKYSVSHGISKNTIYIYHT